MVDTSMHALGAKQLLKIHLGDDDCTLEEDFQGWREALWAAMETQYGISAGEDGALGAADAPTYNVAAASGAQAADAELRTCAAMSDRPAAGVTTQSRPYAAPVLAARELQAPTSGRSCVHVTFDLAGTGITYQVFSTPNPKH
jgi:NADPH-ferrihemoprotein reductase